MQPDQKPTDNQPVNNSPGIEPDNPAGDGFNPQPPVVPGGPSGAGPGVTPPIIGQPRSSKKWLWIILIVILIAALAFGGWWWWRERDESDSSSSTETSSETIVGEETERCTEGLANYVNADLGVGFCYPEEWGAVTVTDAKFDATDTGSRWRISFADNEAVNLGVVSDDWATTSTRDGTCVDPAVQTLPDFSPLVTAWEIEGNPANSAVRGIEAEAGEYFIREQVDDLLTNGVCLEGFTIINGDTYSHTAASYYVAFSSPVTTPQQHIDNSNVLLPEAERDGFYAFVKSVYAVE